LMQHNPFDDEDDEPEVPFSEMTIEPREETEEAK